MLIFSFGLNYVNFTPGHIEFAFDVTGSRVADGHGWMENAVGVQNGGSLVLIKSLTSSDYVRMQWRSGDLSMTLKEDATRLIVVKLV